MSLAYEVETILLYDSYNKIESTSLVNFINALKRIAFTVSFERFSNISSYPKIFGIFVYKRYKEKTVAIILKIYYYILTSYGYFYL